MTVIRILRVLRIFRILKLISYVGETNILLNAIIASKRKIVVFLFFMLSLVTIFGSIMYLIEGSENGFTSIPISIYWAIVTITTVGYGDVSPITPLGKIIGGGFPLAAIAGKKEIEVNSYGRVIREISLDPSQKGKNLQITIDSRLQKFTFDELQSHKAGSIVVLDINSGEILSMVSTPSFNPNLIIKI